MHPPRVSGVVAASLLFTGAAVASMVLSYPTPSTATFSLKAPPVVWQAGPDSSGNSFVAAWSLSQNATYFTLTLRPVPEANVTWGNLTTLSNQDTQAWNVAVSATSLSAYPNVVSFRIEFYAYGTNTLVGAMNLTSASPSLNLGSMAAGTSHYVKTSIQLGTGATPADLPSSVQVSLALS